MIKREAFKKEGRKWISTFVETNPGAVYESLASDLANKFLCKCSYIKRVKRVNNYDGTINISVYYVDDVKAVYTVRR